METKMLPTQKTKIEKDFSKMNTLIYGLPKVGKSTFCSGYPKGLFLATEKGHSQLEIFKVDIKESERPNDFKVSN